LIDKLIDKNLLLTSRIIENVVDGYRGMLIYSQPKWPEANETIVFWCIALGLLALGSAVFRRLKPEFADVI